MEIVSGENDSLSKVGIEYRDQFQRILERLKSTIETAMIDFGQINLERDTSAANHFYS